MFVCRDLIILSARSHCFSASSMTCGSRPVRFLDTRCSGVNESPWMASARRSGMVGGAAGGAEDCKSGVGSGGKAEDED